MSFSVASQNILADSYIKPEYFPHTAPEHLDSRWRWPALATHLARLDADVVCLQEIEQPVFSALHAQLGLLGYSGIFRRKGLGKPDGCAVFSRDANVRRLSDEPHYYGDDSGHLALLVDFEHDGRRFSIANTHVKWQPPTAPVEGGHGLRETTELFERIAADATRRTWIACGDFNATPDSEIVRRILARGFRDPFEATAYTANANGRKKKIDYLFATPDLVGRSRPLVPIQDDTPLPSESQPSDHLAIVADFTF